jgi:hypothetical protein
MISSLRQRSIVGLMALAALGMTINASAAFRIVGASSSTMAMTGEYQWLNWLGQYGTSPVTAQAALPSLWANSNSQWNLEGTTGDAKAPRVSFNSWQPNGVSAVCVGGGTYIGEYFDTTFIIPALQLDFAVSTDDTLEIITPSAYMGGSFTASLEYELQGSTVIVDSWTNSGATKVFNVKSDIEGHGLVYHFRFSGAGTSGAGTAGNGLETIFDLHLTGVAAPAPGALALLGTAGMFGGRRRRSASMHLRN